MNSHQRRVKRRKVTGFMFVGGVKVGRIKSFEFFKNKKIESIFDYDSIHVDEPEIKAYLSYNIDNSMV